MTEKKTESRALLEMLYANGLVWTPPYGATDPDKVIVGKEHHGPYIKGSYNGRDVELVDLVQGILCRIVRPDHTKFVEIDKLFRDGTRMKHVSQAILNPDVEEVRKAIKDSLSHLGDYYILFATSGSTANDMGMRLAIPFTDGGIPFHLKWAYHGANLAQNAICGAPGWNTEVVRKYFNAYQRITDAGLPSHVDHTIDALVQQIEGFRKLRIRPILFAEDIQGVGGGFLQIPNEVMSAAAELLHDAGGLLVNDEVQTLYRRGTQWAADDWMTKKGDAKQAPDIITCAKAVANGETVAFVAVKREIKEHVEANRAKYGKHWDTFSHNAQYLLHAKAVQEIYNGERIGDLSMGANLLRESAYIREGLLAAQQEFPSVILALQGYGGMIGVVLPNNAYVAKALLTAPDYDIHFGSGGPEGQVIRIAPHADFPREASVITVEGMTRLAHTLKNEFK